VRRTPRHPGDTNPRTELTAREIAAEQDCWATGLVPLPPYGGQVEPPGRVTSGRHRKPGETPTIVVVRVVAAFIVVGLATVAGVGSFHGPTQRPSITSAPPAQSVPANTTVAGPSSNTTAPISPRAAAYLDALKRESVPVEDTPTLLLVADSVCTRQDNTNVPAEADRLMAAFPGRWRPQQAATIVDCALKLVCS
jgi:Protein of unknown function (DUF732)